MARPHGGYRTRRKSKNFFLKLLVVPCRSAPWGRPRHTSGCDLITATPWTWRFIPTAKKVNRCWPICGKQEFLSLRSEVLSQARQPALTFISASHRRKKKKRYAI